MRYFLKIGRYKLIALISLIGVSILHAQELPPIRNFAPHEFGAENQNWGISQSEGRLIYLANNSGLLEYNGASWRLFPSPNQTIIRSVTVSGRRIYTGCYREFGYWEKNGFGNLNYYSLSDKIQDRLLEDEEFWSIVSIEGKVFFQSKKRIYSYDLKTESFDFLSLESSFPRIFITDNGVFAHANNEGLFQIIGGKKALINSDEVLKRDEIINVFSDKGKLLILTRENGFYKIIGDVLEKWNIPSENILVQNSIYSAIQLRDKGFVLGTVSNGVLVMDSKGNTDLVFNRRNGLLNNTVLSIHEDVDNNIWLGLDNGISLINLNSPYKVYNDNEGAIGSVYAAVQKDGYLYLGTNQGLYYRNREKVQELQLIEGTQGQVWSLNSINNTLFCGHHSGTFVLEEGTATKIAEVPGTWKIGKIDDRPNLLLQGNYDGLYVLENENGRWAIRNKIEGFNNSSRYFELQNGKLFVNHEYKGVFRITVDATFSEVDQLELDAFQPGFNSGLAKFNDEVFYAFKNGILKYNTIDGRFKLDSVLSAINPENTFISGKMVVDEQNDFLWLFSKNHISRVYRGKLDETFINEKIAIDWITREGLDGYEIISRLKNEEYLIGTSSGYIIMDLSDIAQNENKIHLASARIMAKDRPGQLEKFLDLEGNQKLEPAENNMGFSFYTTSFDKFNVPKYQYQLSGMYPTWSEWSNNASVTFENLPHGQYVFNVRAKVGNSISDDVASFSFQIEKPWYQSTMAIVAYFLLGLIGSFFIHSSYRKYYQKRQNQLIAQNKRQMELTKAQNEKEIIKIKNEQLRQEFKSKSNELAASTLSIIRKNELLTKVKEELMSNPDKQDFIKPIVTIIDKNLKKNDDWELFKEAFNNADRKFLKKLKKAHPKLTPNDIRLCAYLRLNLSSKEIAPLLSISPRSVEIKRYRLRKKMNLSHDDNLTNYILKL
ncbi:MAG: triple tyrosine motif-containing protein [Bacteroidota bacterium]